MRKNAFSAIYVINIVIESFFSMLVSVGLFVLAGWLLVERLGFNRWIYVPLILLGTVFGFFSMYKLIASSMSALDRIENDRQDSKKKTDNQNVGGKL